MIDAKNRKNGELLVILDKYSYEEIRELFKAVLNIREMAVVYLIHCGFSYAKIAKTLKISEDYCRKLYTVTPPHHLASRRKILSYSILRISTKWARGLLCLIR